MISNRVITRLGRRTSKEQDARFTSDDIRVFGVLVKPILALSVPIIDLGAEGEGVVRVEELLVVGIGRVGVGSDLGEDAVGLLDEILVDGVVVGGTEVDTDGAAEDEDGDEAAEDGDLDVVEGLLDLAAAGKRVAAAASRVGGRQAHAGAALVVVVLLPHVARFGGN